MLEANNAVEHVADVLSAEEEKEIHQTELVHKSQISANHIAKLLRCVNERNLEAAVESLTTKNIVAKYQMISGINLGASSVLDSVNKLSGKIKQERKSLSSAFLGDEIVDGQSKLHYEIAKKAYSDAIQSVYDKASSRQTIFSQQIEDGNTWLMEEMEKCLASHSGNAAGRNDEDKKIVISSSKGRRKSTTIKEEYQGIAVGKVSSFRQQKREEDNVRMQQFEEKVLETCHDKCTHQYALLEYERKLAKYKLAYQEESIEEMENWLSVALDKIDEKYQQLHIVPLSQQLEELYQRVYDMSLYEEKLENVLVAKKHAHTPAAQQVDVPHKPFIVPYNEQERINMLVADNKEAMLSYVNEVRWGKRIKDMVMLCPPVDSSAAPSTDVVNGMTADWYSHCIDLCLDICCSAYCVENNESGTSGELHSAAKVRYDDLLRALTLGKKEANGKGKRATPRFL